jgi:hypothetical protein
LGLTRKALQIPGFSEGLEAAVVGFFDCRGETAAGKLSHFKVILQAIAANALIVARVIGTGAVLQIFLFFTFHDIPLCIIPFRVINACGDSLSEYFQCIYPQRTGPPAADQSKALYIIP